MQTIVQLDMIDVSSTDYTPVRIAAKWYLVYQNNTLKIQTFYGRCLHPHVLYEIGTLEATFTRTFSVGAAISLDLSVRDVSVGCTRRAGWMCDDHRNIPG